MAIAWAAAEYLLVKRAMTFFATHYPQVSKMADIYPNVQNQHLGAIAGCEGVRYMHKILPGPCRMAADYGVEMAASCGWQEDVVNVVRFLSMQYNALLQYIYDRCDSSKCWWSFVLINNFA